MVLPSYFVAVAWQEILFSVTFDWKTCTALKSNIRHRIWGDKSRHATTNCFIFFVFARTKRQHRLGDGGAWKNRIKFCGCLDFTLNYVLSNIQKQGGTICIVFQRRSENALSLVQYAKACTMLLVWKPQQTLLANWVHSIKPSCRHPIYISAAAAFAESEV